MITMRGWRRAALAGMAAAWAVTAASAAKQGACRAEVQALCPGLKPGDGKFGPCLKKSLGKLSPVCREAVQRRAAGKRKARPAPSSEPK